MHLPFWLTTAVLFPVLLYQGKRTRQTTPRLPEASGSPFGQYGEGEPARRILVIGESTAAGVGHARSCAMARLARCSRRTASSCRLACVGWRPCPRHNVSPSHTGTRSRTSSACVHDPVASCVHVPMRTKP